MHTLIRESGLPRSRACAALGLARATGYRHERVRDRVCTVRRASHRRLSEAQRDTILTTLNSEKYCDQTPMHVYHALLKEGTYLGSIRTMQRVLKDAQQNRERRPIRPAQSHAVPRLQATGPNQVWTWDISKLALQQRGRWAYLYVLIDLYSRYVVGWMIADTENSNLACQFVGTCAAHHRIAPNTLTLHQDRGSPMTSRNFLALLAELKIDVSHSRPRVSNDNAFSESQFKTIKTQATYPGRFNDTQHARIWCGEYFAWYNDEHQHSGLNGHIPADVYYRRAQAVTETKQTALNAAYRQHPERFVNGPPTAKAPPAIVYINPLPDSIISVYAAPGTNEIMANTPHMSINSNTIPSIQPNQH
jgi:putative transposase